MAKLVSKTYGDALFELGIEKKSIDVLFEEAKFVRRSIAENEDLLKFLNNPNIESAEKIETMENIYRQFVSPDMTGFIKHVVSKGRYNSFIDIYDYFIARVKEYKHIGIVYVTTPKPLSAVQEADVKAKLLALTDYRELEMNYSVDASLIGGMVIRIGDRVVDSSIRTKLNEITKDLLSIQL